MSRSEPDSQPERGDWTFLTNHAHVLLCIARDPRIRQRDIAVDVGITERAAQKIVADLEAAGYIVRERVGRRNTYKIDAELPLRHPMDTRLRVAELLTALSSKRPLHG